MKLSLLYVWCERYGVDKKVHITVVRPQSVTVSSLLAVLESGLQGLGINEISVEQ